MIEDLELLKRMNQKHAATYVVVEPKYIKAVSGYADEYKQISGRKLTLGTAVALYNVLTLGDMKSSKIEKLYCKLGVDYAIGYEQTIAALFSSSPNVESFFRNPSIGVSYDEYSEHNGSYVLPAITFARELHLDLKTMKIRKKSIAKIYEGLLEDMFEKHGLGSYSNVFTQIYMDSTTFINVSTSNGSSPNSEMLCNTFHYNESNAMINAISQTLKKEKPYSDIRKLLNAISLGWNNHLVSATTIETLFLMASIIKNK